MSNYYGEQSGRDALTIDEISRYIAVYNFGNYFPEDIGNLYKEGTEYININSKDNTTKRTNLIYIYMIRAQF